MSSCGGVSSSNNAASCGTDSGCPAPSRAASKIRFICAISGMCRSFAGGGQRLEVNGSERDFLNDFDQVLFGELEQRKERDDDAETAFAGLEQRFEAMESAVPEPPQYFTHAMAHAQCLALDRMAAVQLGALQHVLEREQKLAQLDRRRQTNHVAIGNERARDGEIAIET